MVSTNLLSFQNNHVNAPGLLATLERTTTAPSLYTKLIKLNKYEGQFSTRDLANGQLQIRVKPS